jgi:DNA-binding XRE family transcriptional regulator
MSTFHFRGSMTPADLFAWRQRLALTQAKAASELGCGRRSMVIWEQGQRPIPRYIALACAAVAHGLPALGNTGETK